jgi:hypothetical protein
MRNYEDDYLEVGDLIVYVDKDVGYLEAEIVAIDGDYVELDNAVVIKKDEVTKIED